MTGRCATFCLLTAILGCGRARAAEAWTAAAPLPAAATATTATAAAPAVAAPAAARRIEHAGDVFGLANSTTAENVSTDEYTCEGEKLGTWTQLVTVQRVSLGKPAGTDDFVAYFKAKVAEDGASLDVLTKSRQATVFAVRFPQRGSDDEQVMMCLAFADRATVGVLNIVQYAVKPTRLPVGAVTMKLKAWRDRLMAQAEGLQQADSASASIAVPAAP
jgi:hypothetical protein